MNLKSEIISMISTTILTMVS